MVCWWWCQLSPDGDCGWSVTLLHVARRYSWSPQILIRASARTPKLQFAAEQPLTGECWIPPKKIPHIQGQRRSPRKMVGGAKSCWDPNSIPAKDVWRAQTNLVHIRTQRPPQRLSQNYVWVFPVEVQVSSGLPRWLWVQQTWVCHKPSWRR